MSDNCIIIDWLSFSSKIDDISSLIRLLGIEDFTLKFEKTYGVYGYKDRLAWDGINLNYNPFTEDMGVFVELSGQGCRNIEGSSTLSALPLQDLLRYLASDPDNYNITRVDLAYDDHAGILPMRQIIKDIHKFNFVSKFNARSIRVEEHAGHIGQTVYFGSMKSATMFRLYDKKFERGYEDDDSVPVWNRFEIQLRGDRASGFAQTFLSGEFSIGQIFFGIINNYLRFVSAPVLMDSNKRRWPTAKYWLKFLKSLERISIFTPKDTEYNLYRCEKYVHKQCSNAVEALINAKGVDQFLFDMIQEKPPLSMKYEKLSDNSGAILDFLKERGVVNV